MLSRAEARCREVPSKGEVKALRKQRRRQQKERKHAAHNIYGESQERIEEVFQGKLESARVQMRFRQVSDCAMSSLAPGTMEGWWRSRVLTARRCRRRRRPPPSVSCGGVICVVSSDAWRVKAAKPVSRGDTGAALQFFLLHRRPPSCPSSSSGQFWPGELTPCIVFGRTRQNCSPRLCLTEYCRVRLAGSPSATA